MSKSVSMTKCGVRNLECGISFCCSAFRVPRSALMAFMLISASPLLADWSSWRGPEQNGFVRETAVVKSWSPAGENLLWKSPIGARSTPIIMNGRVYFNAPTGEGASLGEHVVCLDSENGKLIWEHKFNVFHTDIVENRVGWSSMVGDPETGNVYVHGTGGELFCYDKDGKILWKLSLTEEFGRSSGFGGRLFNPIIDEDRLVMTFFSSNWGDQAKGAMRYVAFDKRTGTVLWWATPGEGVADTTYATPVVAVIGGKRLLICPNVNGWVYAIQARTGITEWSYHFAERFLNTSPVVDGNLVYLTHSEENYDTTVMGRVVCVDGSKTGDITQGGEVWRVDGIEAGFATPALANGRLYIVDNSATLIALDAKTGERKWEQTLGRVGKGCPTVTSDGIIYVGEQNGIFYILRDAGDKCEILDKEEFQGPDNTVDEIYSSPAVVDGRVYFTTRYGTYCLAAKDSKPQVQPVPPMPDELAPEKEVARLLIQPADTTLAPGESIELTVSAFDKNGRELTDALKLLSDAPQWSVAGTKGEFTSELWTAKLTAPSVSAYSAGVVKLKWRDKEYSSRVRVVPAALPMAENFDGMEVGKVPPGWLGVAGRCQIAERDGSKALRKLASKERPSPPFMRTRTFMTPPIEGGYTIEADMLGTPKGTRWMPDMGLVNSRYDIILLGAEKALRIVSWAPIPRIQKDVPFEWNTNTWYRMKFQVKLEGGKAMLRGKVWPRDSSEPDAWTIELEDPYPNLEGSPALYAYSAGTTPKSDGTEVFFDNVKVTTNE